MKKIKNFLIIILSFILVLNIVSANLLEYNESFGNLIFSDNFFTPASLSFINYTPLENYSQEIFPIGLSGTNSNFTNFTYNITLGKSIKKEWNVYGSSKSRTTFFIPECNNHNCFITPASRLSFKSYITGQTATSYSNYNNWISLSYVDDFESATIANYSFKMLWADNEDGLSNGFCDLSLLNEDNTSSGVSFANFNHTFDFLDGLHHEDYYGGITPCNASIYYNQPFNAFILNSDNNGWSGYMDLNINLDDLRIEKILNESVGDLPEILIFYNDSFKCLSDIQNEVCFGINITYLGEDTAYYSQITDFKPTKILDVEYFTETKSTFVNFFVVDLINDLNSDLNFWNLYDNTSCEFTTNIFENTFHTKGIQIVQGFTENKTQRLNGLAMISPQNCGKINDTINKTRYFGFVLDNPVRKAVVEFRFFIFDEVFNINNPLYYYSGDSDNHFSEYSFTRTLIGIEIRRKGVLITTLPLTQLFNGLGVYDDAIYGFEHNINLENETDSFKIYKKENNFPKIYVYNSTNFNIISEFHDVNLVAFLTINRTTFFISEISASIIQDNPTEWTTIKPTEFCFFEIGDYESKLYVTDATHLYKNQGFITETLYFSVYDNVTNPLCFLPNQIIISEYDFDNPDSLPPQDTIFNQFLVIIRIPAILSFQLGFLEILRDVVLLVLVLLVGLWYRKLSFDINKDSEDIFRTIAINMFFLILLLYLGLYVEKSVFIVVSSFGLLYMGYEINNMLGVKETDINKVSLYSTAFFNLLSIMFYGFLQVAFKADFGIPTFPKFVIYNLPSLLQAGGNFIGWFFRLLFFSIPDIPIYINVVFLILKVISFISIIAVVRNLLSPASQA